MQIPNPWIYDFKKDFFNTYSRLCLSNRSFYNHKVDVPSDIQIVDELIIWCHEAASLYRFSDANYYRTLEDNDEAADDFYDHMLMNHLTPFILDVYKIAQSEHLCLFVEHQDKFINFPLEEVW